QLDQLYESLQEVEEQANRAIAIPASFDRELTRVREEMEIVVDRLKSISMRKAEVESRSEEAKALVSQSSEVARFVGRVEQGLQVHESIGEDGDLVAEVAELREREAALSKIVSQAGTTKRINAALSKVSLFAQRHIPKLDAERPDDPISLSLT